MHTKTVQITISYDNECTRNVHQVPTYHALVYEVCSHTGMPSHMPKTSDPPNEKTHSKQESPSPKIFKSSPPRPGIFCPLLPQVLQLFNPLTGDNRHENNNLLQALKSDLQAHKSI